METAHMLYMLEHYKDAITVYSKAIASQYIIEAYLGRALCYIKVGKHAEAITDLNHIAKSQYSHQILYLRALAKSYIGHFQTALIDLQEAAKGYISTELSTSISQLKSVCETEIKLGKEYPLLPPEENYYYWFQSASEIIIEFQQGIEISNVTLASPPKSIDITLLTHHGSVIYCFSLYGEVKYDQITQKAINGKIELRLQKVNIGQQWPTLEFKSNIKLNEIASKPFVSAS